MKMFDTYAEHIQDSQYDHAEKFAGFDRGTLFEQYGSGEIVIGRMTSKTGVRIEVLECSAEGFDFYAVKANGKIVFNDVDRELTLKVGRWWVGGCPE